MATTGSLAHLRSKRMLDWAHDAESLKRYIVDAAEGKGKVILIGCEAEIGKSKIIDELRDHAQSRDFRVLSGGCMAQRAEPYLPIVQAFSGVLDYPIIPKKHAFVTFEEIFLVSNAGLLMVHISPRDRSIDEDVVAGMLTAVQDFVRETFADKDGKFGLNRFDYGDKKILIEYGKDLFIAGVIPIETDEIRDDMKRLVALIEEIYAEVVSDWDGERKKFAGAESIVRAVTSKKYIVEQSPEEERLAVLENVTRSVRQLAFTKPLFLLLDNMQWADAETIALLPILARKLTDSSAILCCTFRPEELGPTHQLAAAIDVMKRERLAVEVRFELKRALSRDYGMALFGPILGIRVPKSYRTEFDETDGSVLLDKLSHINVVRLKEEVIVVYMIYDKEYKELTVDEFFDLITGKAGMPRSKGRGEVRFAAFEPSTVGRMIEELIVLTRRILTEVAGKSGKQSAVFTLEGRGKYIKYKSPTLDATGQIIGHIAFIPTVRQGLMRGALDREAEGRKLKLQKQDLRVQVKRRRMAGLVGVVIDTSGSMEDGFKVEIAKAFVRSLLIGAYQKRNMIALITYSGDGATVVLPFTSNLEKALPYLEKIPFGGTTPMASGMRACIEQFEYAMRGGWANIPIMVIVTDGTANTPMLPGQGIRTELKGMCNAVRNNGVVTLVVDISEGGSELARDIAQWCQGSYYHQAV